MLSRVTRQRGALRLMQARRVTRQNRAVAVSRKERRIAKSARKLRPKRFGLSLPATEPPKDYRDQYEELTGISLRLCPVCRRGQMIRIAVPLNPACASPTLQDTS